MFRLIASFENEKNLTLTEYFSGRQAEACPTECNAENALRKNQYSSAEYIHAA